MPRKPRLFVPGVPQHVVQRGNNRQQTFFDESDFELYLDCLRLAGEEFGVSVHAYVLMTNHVHLLVTPDSAEALSQTMQAVGRQYVLKINRKRGQNPFLICLRTFRSASLWRLTNRFMSRQGCRHAQKTPPVRARCATACGSAR
ncbi:transposase [Guyparkeria halophila]